MTKSKTSKKENDANLYKLDFKNQGISQKGTFGTKSKFKGGNLNKAAKQAESNFKRYDQGNKREDSILETGYIADYSKI